MGQHRAISIHAPREGSDSTTDFKSWRGGIFQSTLPVRGATYISFLSVHQFGFQSTLPVRGATDGAEGGEGSGNISIHAPREGSDPNGLKITTMLGFQSTLPVRGATPFVLLLCKPGCNISIHAPREGSDRHPYMAQDFQKISIHAPREGSDRKFFRQLVGLGAISIHAPREGSDPCSFLLWPAPFISIHAPREGSDRRC